MMTSQQVRQFIVNKTVHAFDPVNRTLAAVVKYGWDGRCMAQFANGTSDEGLYGFDGDSYWTRYHRFRGGETHAFRLEVLGPDVMQAWFTTGARAFVQSHGAKPQHWPDAK